MNGVRVSGYDERWPALAGAAIDEVSGLFIAVEHIGSTSVPGLAAKPIIDLMAATGDLTRVHDETLGAKGYRRIDTGMPERLFYRRDSDPAYQLHIVTVASWDARNERILRDHLLAHRADAARYGSLKQELAAAGHGPDDYTRAKTELIQELVDRARTARGLSAVRVWES